MKNLKSGLINKHGKFIKSVSFFLVLDKNMLIKEYMKIY